MKIPLFHKDVLFLVIFKNNLLTFNSNVDVEFYFIYVFCNLNPVMSEACI